MSRQDNIAIAKETMEYTEDFMKRTGSKDCASVEVYSPKRLQKIEEDADGFFARSFRRTAGAAFFIKNADSFEAAYGMEQAFVMNFANAHRPGGGFLTGANAQEESLCRCSTLYKSIACKKAQEMYDYNNTHKNPCDSDYMLLSPSVYVFRKFTGGMLHPPFWTSVVTVSAPNRYGAASRISQDTLDGVMIGRLRKMLYLVARKGYRNLVLGAWGCGAFGNDAKTVAGYFYQLFFGEDGLHTFFENVVFAILGDTDKIEAFREVFKDRLWSGCQDNTAAAGSTDGVVAGYYTCRHDYPVCNHTDGVTDKNLGYTKGITADGVPFEAELFETEEEMTLAVILPAIFDGECGNEKRHVPSENRTNIVGMRYEIQSMDFSILDVGMVEGETEENRDIVKDYVYFLERNGIVTFDCELRNGTVMYRVDVLGNDLAKVLITVREGGDFFAYTDLDFVDFPKKPKRHRNPDFKIVKG